MTDEERNWTNMVNTCKSFQGICVNGIRGPKEDAVLWADAELHRLREEWDIQRSQIEHYRAIVARVEDVEGMAKALNGGYLHEPGCKTCDEGARSKARAVRDYIRGRE